MGGNFVCITVLVDSKTNNDRDARGNSYDDVLFGS